MKSMLLTSYGEDAVFENTEIEKPEVKAGHVLVKISATSVNTVDTMIRKMGEELPLSPQLPALLGMDFAGTVEAVGDEVEGFSIGDEVYGCAGGLADLPGTLAEYIAADQDLIAHKPKNLSMREAAALPLVAITAYEGLKRAGIESGQNVLVHGGSGGVGHVALQLANHWGAKVFSTGGGDPQLALIEKLGATGINYKTESVSEYVAKHTEGAGFDVVYDTVGGENLPNSFEAAALNGQIATTVSMCELDLTPVHFKGLSLHVVFMLILAFVLTSRIVFAQAIDQSATESGINVVPVSEVDWTPLNAARGDASPQAGTLWGDREGSRQTGFLVKFADGFSSPPHIHNVTYRGVVITGQVHNDDPEAEEMWMPKGSYWTQPAGEVHITSAKGAENMAYIEIEKGPYLVWPPEQASDNGERPINVHESNLVWLDAGNTSWVSAEGVELAFLWGKPKGRHVNGTLLKLPAGFRGTIVPDGGSLKAVVIDGQTQVNAAGLSEAKTLKPGSYFSSEGGAIQVKNVSAESHSILYLRTDGPFEIVSIAAAE